MVTPLVYVEPPDIPEGMTIGEWRRRRGAARQVKRSWFPPVRWMRTARRP